MKFVLSCLQFCYTVYEGQGQLGLKSSPDQITLAADSRLSTLTCNNEAVEYLPMRVHPKPEGLIILIWRLLKVSLSV